MSYKRGEFPGLEAEEEDISDNVIINYVVEELEQVESQASIHDFIHLQEFNAVPLRPRTGLTVLADGTNWDPGSGQGVYTYYGATWNKLG